jgi:hypothetical protein
MGLHPGEVDGPVIFFQVPYFFSNKFYQVLVIPGVRSGI